ncbi:Bud site selection protein 6 [Spathaspora sp. JA1]|nr:Bud site selection protein 6 [Spathaspora sp. JA1]
MSVSKPPAVITGSGSRRLNSIDSSVTRLLVSTKHLLESLTQWAHQEADDKFVSDAYVKLGNDFRAATRVFTNSGIDISDIGNVPQALRIILEDALSEAPSQENLDRFLPNIRNIIVTLLQNLKVKQAKAKSLSQESTSKNLMESATSSTSSHNTSKSSFLDPNIPERTSSQVSQSPKNDALSQLQKGDALQRRASKRFSAYQYAKLANFSTTNSLPNIKTPHSSIITETSSEENIDHKANTSTEDESKSHVFLRINKKTKKVDIKFPVTFASLRLLFVEKFAYSPGTTSFPEIYIHDSSSGVSYELEEHLLSDVKSGTLLSLNEPDPQSKVINGLELKISELTTKIETMNADVLSVKETVSSIDIPAPTLPNAQRDANGGTSSYDMKKIHKMEQDLKALRQIHRSSVSSFKSIIQSLMEKLRQFQEYGLEVSKDSNRSFMETCHAKLSEESDVLITKVDDLQDLVEELRKDVAQRGVRINEKQIKNTFKEIENAKSTLHSMTEFISKERTVWKKIWETELDKVCEEQHFFKVQDELAVDLEEDIKKMEETFALIEQCSIEQSKGSTRKRNKVVANLYIPEPGESLHGLKDAVLNEVVALVPNHQSRVEAIERAEKLREKEREMMKLDKFQEELGDFVEDNKLKKSGGIDEVEKMRSQKDIENLKSSFGIV